MRRGVCDALFITEEAGGSERWRGGLGSGWWRDSEDGVWLAARTVGRGPESCAVPAGGMRRRRV